MATERQHLLYDGDCSFCARLGRWLDLRLRHGHALPLQAVDLDALGVEVERARRDVPYVHADGRVDYGPVAIASALRACGGLLGRLGRVLATRPVQAIARPVYRLVADNRHRLPGQNSCPR